ncbi:MAG: hypothetical protein QOI07_3902, partial [Verrucomicrobiota bacterium]
MRRATSLLPLPELWRGSVSECLSLIDFFDDRIAPLNAELNRSSAPTHARSWLIA